MIYVVDEIMGRGKTSAVINMINNAPKEQKFIYAAPYLSECERIKKACKVSRKFVTPDKEESPNKLSSLTKLIAGGNNIVTSHVLIMRLGPYAIQKIKDNGYILIMDETANVVQPLVLDEKDEEIINDNLVMTEKNSYHVRWTGSSKYDGVFSFIKHMCNHGALFDMVNRDGAHDYVQVMAKEIFEAFKDVYVMTYMFKGQPQCWYYDMVGLKYKRLYVNGSAGDGLESLYLSPKADNRLQRPNYAELIHIWDEPKLNKIGSYPTGKRKPLADPSLSKQWFVNDCQGDGKKIRKLKNNLNTVFRRRWEDQSNLNMWTTFKYPYKEQLQGKGYIKGFVPLNTKAVNEYAGRHNLAYACNRYMKVCLKNFFRMSGVKLDSQDEAKYALSEMLQWIWRSAIRNGEEIKIYVPSARMRYLLEDGIHRPAKYDNWGGGEAESLVV